MQRKLRTSTIEKIQGKPSIYENKARGFPSTSTYFHLATFFFFHPTDPTDQNAAFLGCGRREWLLNSDKNEKAFTLK